MKAQLCVGENGRYQLTSRIGRGSFGMIFAAIDTLTRKHVAVKLEPIDCDNPQLAYEYKVYKSMAAQGSWLPKIYWYGSSGDYNALVMERLGPSLQRLFSVHHRLPISQVNSIAPKMIHRLEMCHESGIVHRDIKTDNFVVGGARNPDQIYLIDLGLCKSYLRNDGTHIPFRKRKPFIGTARYASINVHLGYEQSRRDDLEALAYVLIYLCLGSLPWQSNGVPRPDQQAYIGEMKQKISSIELCRGLPSAYSTLLEYAKSLEFEERPDYQYCCDLFHN